MNLKKRITNLEQIQTKKQTRYKNLPELLEACRTGQDPDFNRLYHETTDQGEKAGSAGGS